MAKRNRSAALPAKVELLNFADLHNSQMWVLSDWMNCRRGLGAVKGAAQQRAFLRERCMENLERAQQGYEIIILAKDPVSKGAVPDDVEKRMYQVLNDVIIAHRESMGDAATALISSAVDGIKKEMNLFAREQVKLASENARPIVIKEKGKKDRKVKGVLPPEFEMMVELGAARKNIMLVGPSGCGKTYLGEKLAEALGLEFSDQSCSAGLSESVFTGWLLPLGLHGKFEHVIAPFLDRYENGGVMLLDELDASDANLLTFLNKALANDFFYVPQRYKKPRVIRHPDFIALGAANTFGHGADAMYVGRNQLDAATLDRFRTGMIAMDYSTEVETSLASSPELLEWAWAVRKAIREKSLRRIMSTRTIKDMSDMERAAGWKQAKWEKAYYADWTKEERRLVDEVIQRNAS